MKKLLLLPLLILSYFVRAQQVQYLGAPTTTVETRGVHKVDSAFQGPQDTLASAPNGSTATKNGILYTKSSGHWHQASTSGMTLNNRQGLYTDSLGNLATQPIILHQPVHYITNAPLPANTYSNGSSGSGATLTATSSGYLLADGDTTVLGDRILVTKEVDSTHNGIYTVTTKGDASNAYILTRSYYSSAGNLVAGAMIIADSGKTNQGEIYYQATTGTIVLGTTKLVFKPLALQPGQNLADVPNKSVATSNLGIIPYQSITPAFSAAGSNPDFTVIASGIMQATNAFTLNGPITWGLITFGGHGASFFDSLYPDPVLTQRLDLVFPQVKSVLTVVVGNDESTQAQGITIGPTVSFTNAQFAASMPTIGEAILTGNGTSTWSSAVSAGSLSVSTFSPTNGQTSVAWTTPSNLTQFGIGATTPIIYQGPNQYTIDRTYSGLGAYSLAFNIVEPNGGYLDANPTANDKIIIGPISTGMQALHLGIWTSTNAFLAAGANSNFWVIGLFEVWMIANPVTTTSNQIKWQLQWPSATQYKIYRDVSMAFSSPTLIYTGNAGNFTDTGLTPATAYYYKLMATVGGVDQFVTTFPCPTKPY